MRIKGMVGLEIGTGAGFTRNRTNGSDFLPSLASTLIWRQLQLPGFLQGGHAEQIQTFRGPSCHNTFTARRHTPLYRLKTPSRALSQWC